MGNRKKFFTFITIVMLSLVLTSCGTPKVSEWSKLQKSLGFDKASTSYNWDTFCGGAFVPVFNSPEIGLKIDPILLSGLIAYSNSTEGRDPNIYRDALLNNAFMQSILWPLGSGLNLGMYDWNQSTPVGKYVGSLLDSLIANNKSHEKLCASENKRYFDWNSLGVSSLKDLDSTAIPTAESIYQTKLVASNYPKYENEILKIVAKQNEAHKSFNALQDEYGSPNLVRCKEYATNLPGKTLIQCKLPS